MAFGASLLLAGCGSSSVHHSSTTANHRPASSSTGSGDPAGTTTSPTRTNNAGSATSTTTTTTKAPPSPSRTTSTTTSAATVSSTQLRLAGSVTQQGAGTKVVEGVYLLGPSVSYGHRWMPPVNVQQAYSNQNLVVPSVLDTSAFQQGELMIHYVGGRVPINVVFGTSTPFGNVTGGSPINAAVIYDINGQWTDGISDAGNSSFNLKPGQITGVPIWIQIVGAVSNTEAKLPQNQLNLVSWQITPAVSLIPNPTFVYSGPDAADCSGQDGLLPLAKLPFTASGNATSDGADGTTSCKALESGTS